MIPTLPAGAPVRIVPIDSIQFVEGAEVEIDVPKNWPIRGFLIDEIHTYDVTAGVTLVDEAPELILANVALIKNGATAQTWPGNVLSALNFVMRGTRGIRQVPAVGIADDQPFNFRLYFPCELWGSGKPELTYFNARNYDSAKLRLTFGTINRLISAGAAHHKTGVVNVYAYEAMAAEDKFSDRFSLQRNTALSRDFATATANGAIDLPESAPLRGVLIRVSDAATGLSLSDARLVNVILRLAGSTDIWRCPYRVIHQKMDLDALFVGGTQTIDGAQFYGVPTTIGQYIEGYAWLNFIARGLGDMVNAGGASLQLVLEVTAGTRIEAFPIFLE